jgi:hypothetical protein
MDTDELTGDELTGDAEPGSMDDDVTYRYRAAANLNQIARDAKDRLDEHGIDTPLFFLLPNSGDAVLIFGTPGDPDDDLWNEVTGIVSGIVQQSIGLERPRCRSLACATTHTAPIT